ncbi:MAG: glycosyltransferase family 1 protein [Chloroflexales bacterium]|nr:glycosyltransferase family 1 protein [Chloroflexales bacterium]
MTNLPSPLRIVFAVALQDAGEVTRALELASGLREHCPPGRSLSCTFLSHGSRFTPRVTAAGFAVHECQPRLGGVSTLDDLKARAPEFVGEVGLARELLVGIRQALAQLQPDLVIYGFWPFAGIARRMLGIPGVCFLPLPLHPSVVGAGLLSDVPDMLVPLTALPRPLRRALIGLVPAGAKVRAPGFRQHNMRLAAEAEGWRGEPLASVFEMLESDLLVVNDLPDFYVGQTLPDHVRITGPLYAPAGANAEVDPAIRRLFDPAERRPKVFCTMGSSGTREPFLWRRPPTSAGARAARTAATPPSAPIARSSRAT